MSFEPALHRHHILTSRGRHLTPEEGDAQTLPAPHHPGANVSASRMAMSVKMLRRAGDFQRQTRGEPGWIPATS